MEDEIKADRVAAVSSVEGELRRVVHELHVHQAELEAQNEELRQAQNQLAEIGDRLADLYDFAPVGYLTLNDRGFILEANLTLTRLLGVERSSLVKRPFSRFVCKEDGDAFFLHFRKAIETPSKEGCELRLAPRDGNLIHARLESLPVRNEHGHVRELRLVVSDITELKRAEKDKEDLERQLRHAHRMEAVGTLAAGIAHEFNNILGIILGNAELASLDIPDWSPVHRHIETVKSSTARARDVVRQLLTFARKTEEHRRPVDLAAVVEESLTFLRSSLPASLEFLHHFTVECRPVSADPTQIHQIIINLCTNAADAMEGAGVLEFCLENVDLVPGSPELPAGLKPGDYVKLQVRDNGCGISPDILDRIFDPFFTTKEVNRGTGMGLAVVHGIVASHGGAVQVESVPGKGATFTIFLPAISEFLSVETLPSNAPPTGSERILFLDDEEQLAILGRMQLESLGYSVRHETGSKKALEIFRETPHQFDLIVTDMTMPEMTGEQLVREVLKIRPDMPVILCTGYSERMSEERARSIGARGYAIKPLSRDKLAGVVRNVLEKRL